MSDNELIAEFTGGVFNADSDNPDKWWFNPQPTKHYRKDAMHLTIGLKYDTEWDWLMPVVEKIEESLLGQVEIHTAYTNINGEFNNKKYNQDSCFESQNDTKLDVTYRAVVKFIKWFQEQ